MRRPYDRGGFNTIDYTSQQELLGDIEKIWLTTLEEELGITKEELKVSLFSFLVEAELMKRNRTTRLFSSYLTSMKRCTCAK